MRLAVEHFTDWFYQETKMTMTISRQLLSIDQRSIHAANLFGLHFQTQFEPYVFETASELSPDYRGGYWEFYDLSNGGFYMAPDAETPFRVASPNGYEGILSGDALGITACLFAFSNLSFIATKPVSTTYAQMFHALREYAVDHAEASGILSATD